MAYDWIKIILIIGIIFISWGCKKEKLPQNPTGNVEEAMLVLNEGNFMFGNSTLSLILNLQTVQEDVFREKNGYGLGDVGQSLCYHHGFLYLVANNSNKIYQLDTDFKVKGIISGLNSPRYFLPFNDSLAFVTDLYENGVYVVNFKTFTKVKFISIPGWTEELIFYQNKVWVTNPYSASLYILNPETQTLEDSLALPSSFGATALEVDAFNNLWALCWGNHSLGIPPTLVKIKNKNVEKTFVFPNGSNPSHLEISNDKQNLFWINDGIYKMPVNKNELSVVPMIEKGNRNFYNFYLHPNNNEIWIADAKDYVQKGHVLRYSPSGELLNTFKVGIIPSTILYFKK